MHSVTGAKNKVVLFTAVFRTLWLFVVRRALIFSSKKIRNQLFYEKQSIVKSLSWILDKIFFYINFFMVRGQLLVRKNLFCLDGINSVGDHNSTQVVVVWMDVWRTHFFQVSFWDVSQTLWAIELKFGMVICCDDPLCILLKKKIRPPNSLNPPSILVHFLRWNNF